jgi:hypothetical protein
VILEPDKIGLAEKIGNAITVQRLLTESYHRLLNAQANERPNSPAWQGLQPEVEAHLHLLNQVQLLTEDAFRQYASFLGDSRQYIEQTLLALNIPDSENPVSVVMYGPVDVLASSREITTTDVTRWIEQALNLT